MARCVPSSVRKSRNYPQRLGMVHNGGANRVVFDRYKGSRQGAGHNNRRSRVFEGLLDVESNKSFILDDEDDASDERTFHGMAFSAAKRDRLRQGDTLIWSRMSRASINPQRATSVMTDREAKPAKLRRARCCVFARYPVGLNALIAQFSGGACLGSSDACRLYAFIANATAPMAV
jgi:hypothetical protein